MSTNTREGYVDHVVDAPLIVRALTENTDGMRRLTGIANTPTLDRLGTQILPMGARFRLPLPLLWQHDPNKPMGNVTSAKVTPEGIEIEAEFDASAPEMEPAIARHWAQLKAGLVRHLSIGFRELKSRAIKGGRVFTEWELLEVSAVTIAGNPECVITAVRAYAVPSRDALPRPNARPQPAPNIAGATAAPAVRTGANPMTTAERIAATKLRLSEMRERVADLAASDELDDEAQTEINELSSNIQRDERQLAALENAQAVTMGRAQPVGTNVARAPRSAPVVITRTRQPEKADLLWKGMTAAFYSYSERAPMEDVLARHYAGNSDLEIFVRAASQPARTDVVGWAAELVQTTIGDYIDALVPLSVYGALTSQGGRFSFGRAGKVTLPVRSGVPGTDLAGDWVGEGAAIPVKRTTLTSLTLSPHKLAVISTFTRELAQHSTPEIEGLIRRLILEDTAAALDKFLLDNVAASATRPAGLLNGVTGVPSTGAGFDNMRADLVAALTAITAAGGGRNLVWLMNPAQALTITFTTDATGGFLFAQDMGRNTLMGARVIVSTNVPAGTVILVDAADFASALGDVPSFDVSDVATLHMEGDVALVKPITGPGATDIAVPVRSLWQTASVGVRMIQDLSWGMRRAGMVYAITGVAW